MKRMKIIHGWGAKFSKSYNTGRREKKEKSETGIKRKKGGNKVTKGERDVNKQIRRTREAGERIERNEAKKSTALLSFARIHLSARLRFCPGKNGGC